MKIEIEHVSKKIKDALVLDDVCMTENDWAADYFMKMVDAACVYVNVPT